MTHTKKKPTAEKIMDMILDFGDARAKWPNGNMSYSEIMSKFSNIQTAIETLVDNQK